MSFPEISVEQMKDVDRIMIQDFNISLLQMMENAGRILANLAHDLFPNVKNIAILVGKGNNGGGGLVAARYLHNKGLNVNIVLANNKLKQISKLHLKTLEAMAVPINNNIAATPNLFIDTLLGYNAKGTPHGRIAELIKQATSFNVPVLSLDIPSGFDLNSGKFFNPSFKNAVVLTLGLPKKNMLNNPGISKLYVADIGIPREVYNKINLDVPQIFSNQDYIELR